MNKVLNWPGGKWSVTHNIISILPKHNIYLEPFFGSGAVFFNKEICNTEILNDADGQIVNLFKCIRDKPVELANAIYFTPYARDEYISNCNFKETDNDIEKARKFIVRTNMSRGGLQKYKTGWRHAGPKLSKTNFQKVIGKWNDLPDYILNTAIRLKDAEIENRDAIDLIKKYNKSDCLIYADPPYLLKTRSQKMYNIEMETEEEHEKLLKVLLNHVGPAIISGYDSNLYNCMLKSWNKLEFRAYAEQGRLRKEVLWTNFETTKQLSLFK
ncbi:DNA adenine methylase [Clostridioides difficile]|nr:DNA adenine methylase [Clostridioides difficile]